jgi:hypothetical protein
MKADISTNDPTTSHSGVEHSTTRPTGWLFQQLWAIQINEYYTKQLAYCYIRGSETVHRRFWLDAAA